MTIHNGYMACLGGLFFPAPAAVRHLGEELMGDVCEGRCGIAVVFVGGRRVKSYPKFGFLGLFAPKIRGWNPNVKSEIEVRG